MKPRSHPWVAALATLALPFGFTGGPLPGQASAQGESLKLRVWDQFTDLAETENAERMS